MGIVFTRARWAAPLVFVAVLIIAFAPDAADAHGGYGPETSPARAPNNDASAPGFGAASAPASSASPFCPGGSGHTCECAELAALVRADETPVLHHCGAHLPVRPSAGPIKPAIFPRAPPSAPLLSPASPRAPPLYA